MSEDYITRSEHTAAIERLERADSELAARILDTERQLRGEFVQSVTASEERISHRFDAVDEHLTRQDEHLIGRRINWPKTGISIAVGAVSMVAAYLTLHFGFHIG